MCACVCVCMWCKKYYRHRECVYFNILLSHHLLSGIKFSAYIFRINRTTHTHTHTKKLMCVHVCAQRMPCHNTKYIYIQQKEDCHSFDDDDDDEEKKKKALQKNETLIIEYEQKQKNVMHDLPIAIKFSINFNISFKYDK